MREEALVLEEHGGAPGDDHAEGKNEEQPGGLLQGDDPADVVARQVAHGEQDEHDQEEDLGTVHHDPVLHEHQPRGADERVGEHYGADEKGSERPDERNAETRYDKHRETGGHAQGREDDGLERHLPAPLAKPPQQHTNEAQQSNNSRRTWSE